MAEDILYSGASDDGFPRFTVSALNELDEEFDILGNKSQNKNTLYLFILGRVVGTILCDLTLFVLNHEDYALSNDW